MSQEERLDPLLEQLANKYPSTWVVLTERVGKQFPTVEECLQFLSLHSPRHPAHIKLLYLTQNRKTL